MKLSNKYLRYLGAYIRFFDAHGKPMSTPDWSPDGYSPFEPKFQHDDLRYLGHISPVDTIMATPASPGYLSLNVTFPEGATSAKVYGGGIGTGIGILAGAAMVYGGVIGTLAEATAAKAYGGNIGGQQYANATATGAILTAIVNFTIPTFMLGFGAAVQSYKPLYDIVNDGLVTKIAIAALLIYMDVHLKEGNALRFETLEPVGKLLFSQVCTKLLAYVEAEAAAEEVADQIPFAGWIMLAINVATGVAQMAMTIAEVATSPWLIENTISTTITSTVTLHPDPQNKSFPRGLESRSYTVRMIYKDQNRPSVTSSRIDPIPDNFTGQTLPGNFPGNTLGGEVKFEAEFYIGSWVAGRASTGWIPNDEPHTRDIHLYLVQNPIPLNDKSIYQHHAILQKNRGKFEFRTTPTAPTATRASANFSSGENALADWTGLALSQRYGMLGLSWQAAGLGIPECSSGEDTARQLYTFVNVNIPGTPMDTVLSPACGFQGKTRLVYDPFPPKFLMDSSGRWVLLPDGKHVKPDPKDIKLGEYFVDPSKSDPNLFTIEKGRGYHLRKIQLAPGVSIDPRNMTGSWGRFPYFPDSVAMHPSGYIISVNSEFHKLQVLKVETRARADDQVELARSGAGKALQPDRPGLMFRPLAVSCTYEGTIIVLEENRSASGSITRLSAFDLHMNPISRFQEENNKATPWLNLNQSEGSALLDMTTVGNQKLTHVFVLSYEGDGSRVSQYKMQIYAIPGKGPTSRDPLITTRGVAAARLAVDIWHTAYTLNYAPVTDAGGNPIHSGGAQPSVSEWLPPTPKGSS